MKLSKYIPVILLIGLVAGCTSWRDAGRTVLETTGPVIVDAKTAFLANIDNFLRICDNDGDCLLALEGAAISIDVTYDTWWIAKKAYDAGDQEGFFNAAACLMESLEQMHAVFKSFGFQVLETQIKAVIAAGKGVVSSYGGQCL